VIAFRDSPRGHCGPMTTVLSCAYEGHLYFPLVKDVREPRSARFPTPGITSIRIFRDRFSQGSTCRRLSADHYYYDHAQLLFRRPRPGAPIGVKTGSAPTTAAAMCSRDLLYGFSRVSYLCAGFDRDRHGARLLAGAVQGLLRRSHD